MKTRALTRLWLVLTLACQTAPGAVLRFDGFDDYVLTPDITRQFTDETVTLELWFKPRGPGILVDERQASSAAGWRDSQIELVATSDSVQGDLRIRVWNSPYLSLGRVNYGTWNHVVLRYNKATLTLDGFLNGIRSAALSPFDRIAPWEAGTTLAYSLGRSNDQNLGSGAWFSGWLDEFRVWNVARTDAELSENAARRLRGDEPGLVLYYAMTNQAGAVVSDSGPKGLHGQLVNGVLWALNEDSLTPIPQSGTLGQVSGETAVLTTRFDSHRQPASSRLAWGPGSTALSFDGFSSVVFPTNLNVYPLTVTAWIKPAGVGTGGALVNQYVSGSMNGWNLRLMGGRLRAWYFRNSVNYVWDGDQGLDGGPVDDGQWHHVALTVGPSGGTLFVDGQPTATRAWAGTPGQPTTSDPLRLGVYFADFFAGQMDDVTIWNAELDPTAIAALMVTPPRPDHLNYNNLLAYWPLDGDFEDVRSHIAANAISSNLKWTPEARPILERLSAPQPIDRINQVLNLDGLDDHAVVPAGIWFEDEFTVEAWVYPRSRAMWQRVLDFGNGAPAQNVLLAITQSTSGKPFFQAFPSGQYIVAPEPLPLKQWAHIAVSFQAGVATMFINGVPVVSGPVALPAPTQRLRNYIGRSHWTADAHANAMLDDVRIWKAARSPEQIRQFMFAPVNPSDSDLALNCHFETAAGSATPTNGASLVVSAPVSSSLSDLTPGKVYFAQAVGETAHGASRGPLHRFATPAPGNGTALQFDGANDYARIADIGLRIPTNQITIEFWQRIHNAASQTTFCIEPDQAANRLLAHVPWGNGAIYWDFGDPAGDGRLTYTPAPGLQTWIGTWQHFALVAKAGPNGSMQIYRNGQLEASKARAGSPHFPDHDLKLGILGTLLGYSLNGELDEFRIWDRAMTATEIREFQTRRVPPDEPGLVACYRMDEGGGEVLIDSSLNQLHGLLAGSPLHVPSTAPVGRPFAVTLPATGVAHGRATLNGTVSTDGVAPASAWFEYATNSIVVPASAENRLALYRISASATSLNMVDFAAAPAYVRNFETINAATDAAIWPGGADDFAALFSGRIYVPAFGLYTFYTSSDDGSRLFINGKLVVENDGMHGTLERSGSISLPAGHHRLDVQYFEGVGAGALFVSWAGPGIPKQIIPADAFLRRDPVYQPLMPVQSVPETSAGGPVVATLDGLKAGSICHFRLVATNANGASYGTEEPILMPHPTALSGLFFDGVDDYVITPDATSAFTNESLTVELWVNARAPGVVVVEKDDTTAWYVGLIEITSTADPAEGELRLNVSGATRPISLGSVPYGSWNHVVLRYDRTARVLDGFLNGVKATDSLRDLDRRAPFESRLKLFFALGLKDLRTANTAPWFHGYMDEFRVWSLPRSDAEILRDYDRRISGTEPGLVIYYGFDDGNVTLALNTASTEGALNGTLVNGPVYAVSGARLYQPVLATLPAESVRSTSAVLRGTVNPSGYEGQIAAWFDYGTSPSFGRDNATSPAIVQGGLGPQPVTLTVTNLESGTRYFYRLVSVHNGRTIYGQTAIFETLVVGEGYPISTRAGSGRGTTNPRHITDAEGDIYLAGLFSGSCQFKQTLQAAGAETNAFLAKLGRKGDWRWAINIPVTNGLAQIQALALDQGTNLLVGGSLTGTAIFGKFQLSAPPGATLGFVARFDPSTTNWSWATAIGSSGVNSASAVAVAPDGSAYIAGEFSGSTQLGSFALTATGRSDMFVARLNSNGDFRWVTQAGGSGKDSASALAVGASGELFVTGSFEEQALFPPYLLQSAGKSDLFFATLSNQGKFQTAIRAGGTKDDRGTGIAADPNGDVYLLAQFTEGADFNGPPLPEFDTAPGAQNLLIAQLDTKGVLFARAAARGAAADSLVVAAPGQVYVSGDFAGVMSYGPNLITIGTGANASSDVFLARLAKENDSLAWADLKQIGGIGPEFRGSVSVDPAGSVLVSGTYSQSLHVGYVQISTPNPQEIFLARLDPDGTYEHNLWEIGQALIPPEQALESVADNRAKGLPIIEILRTPPALPDSASDNSFWWNEAEKRLYPIRPVTARIKWPLDQTMTNLANVATIVGRCGWPSHPRTNIAGVPVEVQGPGVGRGLYCGGIVFNTNGASVQPVTRGAQQFQIFQTPTNASGYNVIHYTSEPIIGKSSFEVVFTRPYGSWVPEVAQVIGKPLTRSTHQDSTGKNGYILVERSFYDAMAHDRASRTGPIIPVNRNLQNDPTRDLVVVWYRTNELTGIAWGSDPVRYALNWAEDAPLLVIAGARGDGVDDRPQARSQVYHQPDPNLPGFNPNEEHAFIMEGRVFALRCDLNDVLSPKASDPYVLVRSLGPQSTNDWQMAVYKVVAEDTAHTFAHFATALAGREILPPTPLNLLPLCASSNRIAFGGTHAYQAWNGRLFAKSAGYFQVQYWYPTQPDFYFGPTNPPVGTCVPWLSHYSQVPVTPGTTRITGEPVLVGLNASWPDDAPQLKFAATLTERNHGLPDLLNFAAARIIYDDGNPQDVAWADSLVRIFDPLSERTVQLTSTFKLPPSVNTADDRGRKVFPDLPYPLRLRLLYDADNRRLSFGGWYDPAFGNGEPLLLPNIMSLRERDRIRQLVQNESNPALRSAFLNAIDSLYNLTRNPNQVDADRNGFADTELRVGLITQIRDGFKEILAGPVMLGPQTNFITWRTNLAAQPVYPRATNIVQEQFGNLPKAMTAGLRPGSGYVTVVENDDPRLSPIGLHVIFVTNSLYTGDLKVLESDNVFDERLALRHSGDFAGEPQHFEFEWYYQPDQSGVSPRFPEVTENSTNWNGWIRFPTGPAGTPNGLNDLTLGEGNNLSSLLVLSDNWILCRFRGFTGSEPTPWSAWVGAPGGDGAMLAMGWIKRVIAGLNEFDSRTRDFHVAPAATYASMILQAGKRYEGPIAFNPDPAYLNSVGLIESYQTVLNRARKLSVDASPPVNFGPANNALLRAAGKIADLYALLGNEAFADASDPTIGFTTSSGEYGNLAPSIFCFQNQLDSPLEEELALLRGRDDSGLTVRSEPFYNRLIWNFTQGEGEIAYKLTYNISNQNNDSTIDEKDATLLYPQGHGDAWGHYLTATKMYYDLLRHAHYEWIPRPEAVTVGGSPVLVDYLDERKFAQLAAAKAKAGAEIVNLTYRQKYVEDPAGQWQGYKDTQTDRAWGVAEWATRAGQSTYFDWVVANAVLPATDPDPSHVGIQKIDRTTVSELSEIAAQFTAIESQLDTVDRGLNPLGLAAGATPFDIDPSKVASGQTHFDQIYERATRSMQNTLSLFDHVNGLSQSLRRNQDDVDAFTANVEDQERDYKNRMIEIFGYPYPGDIGPAGTYPSGYDGPDLYHYMYVDATDLTGEKAEPTRYVTGYFKPLERQTAFFPSDVGNLVPVLSADGTFHVEYPMVENGNYLFQAPNSWGKRRAPGKIQQALSEMLKARAQLAQGVDSYENLRKQLGDEIDLLDAHTDQNAAKFALRMREATTIFAINAIQMVNKLTGEKAEAAGEKAQKVADAVAESLPKSVGLANDVTAPARGAVKTAGNATAWAMAALELVATGGEAEAEHSKLVLETQTDLGIELATDDYAIKQQLKVIEQLARQEAGKRLEIYTLQEHVSQAAGGYLSALAEGQRSVEERYSFRVKTAAQVQEHRYQDMAFRIFQNDALQKYRAQFDLTARYVYLAAKAYDYETCLLNADTGAGSKLLTDIVRQRTLGQLVNGLPVSGRQGLADPLARLGQNFDVYRGQLGFATPETETGRFSLRSELFRIRPGNLQTNVLNSIVTTNQDWTALLQKCRVPDLWQVPEFRRFCRPFAPESAGPQPGLVIRIPTTITFGLNYFGWPLGPGDSAYDPSRFATKVRSAGVWFSDYHLAGLSMTPRVYLVPAGMDVMRSPSSPTLETRTFRVVDQKLPVPFPIGTSDLRDPSWIPGNDSLSETFGEIRRFSSFRAYHDRGWFDQAEATQDTRLIGRSVWNTEWLLIIPGGTFLYDPDRGLDTFIATVEDIKVFFQTYSYSGN